MRVMFAGSPPVALPALVALHESRHELVGVLTQPPRPVGRKRVLTPTAVEVKARELGIPVSTPTDSAELLSAVETWRPDVAVVVAFGQLLTGEMIGAVPQGWWNLHFSLLPRWRGAAPVQHAVLAGDDLTGVTIFRIDKGLDTGDIATRVEHPLTGEETAGEVLEVLSELALAPLLETLEAIESGSIRLTSQTGKATVAPKPAADFGRIRWADPADRVLRRVRAATPAPGAYATRVDTGQRVLMLECASSSEHVRLGPGEITHSAGTVLVGTGEGLVELKTVLPAGKRPMPAVDWFRGLPEGVCFVA